MTISLKRAPLAATVIAIGLAVPATAVATHIFDDVDDGRFYTAPAEWAKDNDITTGSPAGSSTFKPEDPVTRGESVTFLKRYDDNVVQPALDGLGDDIAALEAPETVEMTVGAGAFGGDDQSWAMGCIRNPLGTFELQAGIQLPVGATITDITGWIRSPAAGPDAILRLVRITDFVTPLASLDTSGSSDLSEFTTGLADPEVVDSGDYFYLEYVAPDGTASHQICGAAIEYTIGSGLVGLSTSGDTPDGTGIPGR